MPAFIMSSSNYFEKIWFAQYVFELDKLWLGDKSQESLCETCFIFSFWHSSIFFVYSYDFVEKPLRKRNYTRFHVPG